jgi:hypothetical protein
MKWARFVTTLAGSRIGSPSKPLGTRGESANAE